MKARLAFHIKAPFITSKVSLFSNSHFRTGSLCLCAQGGRDELIGHIYEAIISTTRKEKLVHATGEIFTLNLNPCKKLYIKYKLDI